MYLHPSISQYIKEFTNEICGKLFIEYMSRASRHLKEENVFLGSTSSSSSKEEPAYYGRKISKCVVHPPQRKPKIYLYTTTFHVLEPICHEAPRYSDTQLHFQIGNGALGALSPGGSFLADGEKSMGLPITDTSKISKFHHPAARCGSGRPVLSNKPIPVNKTSATG